MFMNMASTELAKRLIEVLPPLMRKIRGQVREVTGNGLTVPQFRILAQIQDGPCHIGEIAEHNDVSQPAMSKMIEGLVSRGLVFRASTRRDGRLKILKLTVKGQKVYRDVRRMTHRKLSDQLAGLSTSESEKLLNALSTIESVFCNPENK
jgi:DNA-binding MarR family transcriptional regulator